MSQQQFTERFKKLTDRQQEVLLLVLAGQEDLAIAQTLQIVEGTVRKHIENICKVFRLTPRPGERSIRPELIELFKQYRPDLVKMGDIPERVKVTETATEKSRQEPCPAQKPSSADFVGRKTALADLNTLIDRAKIIVIQAAGGVGKTTLASEYLKSQRFDLVIDIQMAKEKESITPVESVVEEWLKRDFKEEPGREFGVMLGRLKRQLQTRKVGVLIDNLEPALDKQGRFIEPHRRYVELLRILGDSTVQSVTLITSRDRLCDDGVNVKHYPLPGLDKQAWQHFFSNRNVNIHTPTLKAMHNAYGGNAKAMEILCGAIGQDFDGDMAAYWRENSVELLVKPDLKNLVTNQFNRLQEIDCQAYQLLCRLGCYRYQDVPNVPTEGLLCLLWDVEEVRRRRIIESLRNRSLVESQKIEYWLHPMIREEAIARLRASEDWQTANHIAAEFWTESVKAVETLENALKAFEAYYHYIEIKNFISAANVIINHRANKWEDTEPLGRSFYRLGLLQEMIYSINLIISHIKPSYVLSLLHNILGDLYWLTGNIRQAIASHEKSEIVAHQSLENFIGSDRIKFELKKLTRHSLFNKALCYLELWQLKEAIELFEKVQILSKNAHPTASEIEKGYIDDALVDIWSYLAFLNSCLGSLEKSSNLAKNAYSHLFTAKLNSWSTGYAPLFLGLTYKNLGDTQKSFAMYNRALAYAEESHYTQVKAKAFTGLAELYREKRDFETALSHHSEAIEILEKIGAKCDLAEAYYQRALTDQKMGNTQKSQTNFQEAIQLFSEMEAPKQVEKVQRAMENGG
ncbi:MULTISPECIES: tetratricopeptide repeat protein [unclassified Microcoleus]|uniref:tetratricopeptide repeat protein n=1 Tax=unclassified Microcoleus TaxID=2642155 RepID=UPI0025EC3F2D|nr:MULTISPECIES: tetratricopeptide repeat protein [unclassified Microcoleus]